ncbi:uncharacterized protein LOC128952247 [Oppia nitens]|uniref:uncharacterized protein LOC128952247 n=1 Tax=Oppia nitens TaxID=1686743 RepID=UPI0023D9E841|nr:uncharacterized protein LOC128952247 [Oppia nitens]
MIAITGAINPREPPIDLTSICNTNGRLGGSEYLIDISIDDNRCPQCNSQVVVKTNGYNTPPSNNNNNNLMKFSDQSAEKVVNNKTPIRMCCICLDESVGAIKQLNCGHSFHNKCINRWFATKHNTCPICRQTTVVSPIPSSTTRLNLFVGSLNQAIHALPVNRVREENGRATYTVNDQGYFVIVSFNHNQN